MSMHSTMRTTVVGVFRERRNAHQAITDLKAAGFTDDQVGVVTRDEPNAAGTVESDDGSMVGTGAATGVAAGAGIGALWAIGIAAGFLPAIGPVIAGGIFAALLASAAGAAAVGGLVGALIGLGIPQDEAEFYEEEFKSGRTIVTVKAEGRVDQATSILRTHGAYDMHTSNTALEPDTASRSTRPRREVQTHPGEAALPPLDRKQSAERERDIPVVSETQRRS